MNVTLQNLGLVPVPVSCTQVPTLLAMLEPGAALVVNHEDNTVVNVGDNPTFWEEFNEGLQGLLQALKGILEKIARRREEEGDDLNEHPTIVVEIGNHGPNALRVLLGSNLDEVQIDAGKSLVATGPRYVEIRELGV